MTEFTELYKKLSNAELLSIIAESEKYNAIAVDTAKMEIETRKLTEDQINQAKSEIEEKKIAQKLELEKRKQQKKKIKETVFSLYDTINPIQSGIQTPEKVVRLTILVFSCLAIFSIYQEFEMIKFMFTNNSAQWDFSMVVYILLIFLLPIAVILFWLKHKLGWILLSIFLSHSSFNAILLFFMNFGRQPSEISLFEEIFPSVSPLVYILSVLFYGSFLYLICKKNIRNVFKVEKLAMLMTIVLTLLAESVFVYSIFA